MTKEEWAVVLARIEDEERRVALLMLADEDWLSEESACWLRKVSKRVRGLKPCKRENQDVFWWKIDSPFLDNNSECIPEWLLSRMDRRSAGNAKDPSGHYSPERNTPEEAWLDLLAIL
jgi:hypothetical protein